MIKIASNKDDIIFDPFMGVGSMGVAALELDRRFIGVEREENYFIAAKQRFINVLNNKHIMTKDKEYKLTEEETSTGVCESAIPYQSIGSEMNLFFHASKANSPHGSKTSTGLQPIIKWPGGKEKELKYILPNAPTFRRFFEPFVGGGSVFMSVQAKEYFINDFSSELISLYRYIASTDKRFFAYVEMMDDSWEKALKFFNENKVLVDMYKDYRENKITKEVLKGLVHDFCKRNEKELLLIISEEFVSYSCILLRETEKNLFRKMVRMREIELKKHTLPDKDLLDNIETAIKSAIYMNYRFMYNDKTIERKNPCLHTALFFFMRNYAYSGMFRYSNKGDFNVPYGGIAYNRKLMAKKLDYYRSEPLLKHFADTQIYSLDFEAFLRETNPSKDDFVFLDPPYDSEFSTYAQHAFTRDDQERLAHYMIYECKAKWMMIIKNTDFIYELYNKKGINIRTFDKEYLVSFMNRNDKKVTHLLITNY